MDKCEYCNFTDFDEDGIHSYGQDLVEMGVWLKNNESTGEAMLESNSWGEIKVNYCPVCGKKLGI